MAFRIWRAIASNYHDMEKHASDGYRAQVEVHLHGAGETLVVSAIHSREDSEWVLFCVGAPFDPSARLVFAPEGCVARAEVRYVRDSEATVGFRVDDAGLNES